MTIIYLNISRCFQVVAEYMVIIMVVVCAFAVLGYCTFGTQVEEFSTINDSLISVMRILVRDFDYHSIAHVDQTLTTVFFIIFTCVVIFVLLTMLVAIVFHAYFDVDIGELTIQNKAYVWDKLFMTSKNETKNYYSYQDIYKLLKRCNYVDNEVKYILKQNNIEDDTKIDGDKFNNLIESFYEINTDSDESNNDEGEIQKISYQLKLLDTKMEALEYQIDVVIARLNKIKVILPSDYAEQSSEVSETQQTQ
ncbi:polycystic kidney disease 2-like 2 protein [Daktulosphaira vitifoliae]|uniref:polycystic kidney disease 2-like 2 protein n=1 Tax=Daktulosphaira vitifoliae TaxID=58002 RepID=UPI0021AABB36|nr:polycystic kidney disease 2-like 2 protein [Daktulosphaira vitifoliae]